MTNYERIKSMSIEEMARMLCDSTSCDECEVNDMCDGADTSRNGFTKWLESEVAKTKCCYDCVFCSWHYPSKKNLCELDEHEIKNVHMQCCEKYEEADDNQEEE